MESNEIQAASALTNGAAVAAEETLETVAGEGEEQPSEESFQTVDLVLSEGVASENPEDLLELDAETQTESDVTLPLTAQICALLFVSPRPLSLATLSEATKQPAEQIELALEQLGSLFQEQVHGISLCEVADAYQLRTSVYAAKVIHRLIPPRSRRLSKAAAETLAVVAYKQPVQRAEIEAIRGVDALPTLKTLIDAKLIRIVGREASAGQPALYGTTATFLEKFGLKDLSELPTTRELAQFAAEPGEPDAEESIDTAEFQSEEASEEERDQADAS